MKAKEPRGYKESWGKMAKKLEEMFSTGKTVQSSDNFFSVLIPRYSLSEEAGDSV